MKKQNTRYNVYKKSVALEYEKAGVGGGGSRRNNFFLQILRIFSLDQECIPAGITELEFFPSRRFFEIVFLLTDFESFLRDRYDYPRLVAFEISLDSF